MMMSMGTCPTASRVWFMVLRALRFHGLRCLTESAMYTSFSTGSRFSIWQCGMVRHGTARAGDLRTRACSEVGGRQQVTRWLDLDVVIIAAQTPSGQRAPNAPPAAFPDKSGTPPRRLSCGLLRRSPSSRFRLATPTPPPVPQAAAACLSGPAAALRQPPSHRWRAPKSLPARFPRAHPVSAQRYWGPCVQGGLQATPSDQPRSFGVDGVVHSTQCCRWWEGCLEEGGRSWELAR